MDPIKYMPQSTKSRTDELVKIIAERPAWVDELLEEMDRYDLYQTLRALAVMGVVAASWFFRAV